MSGLSGFWTVYLKKPLKNRLKTAQIMLEKPFKNHRKKWAVFERFFKQDMSGLSGFSKKKPPKPPVPLKPLKSFWKTAQTAHNLSGFWAGSRPGIQRIVAFTEYLKNPNLFLGRSAMIIFNFYYSFIISLYYDS